MIGTSKSILCVAEHRHSPTCCQGFHYSGIDILSAYMMLCQQGQLKQTEQCNTTLRMSFFAQKRLFLDYRHTWQLVLCHLVLYYHCAATPALISYYLVMPMLASCLLCYIPPTVLVLDEIYPAENLHCHCTNQHSLPLILFLNGCQKLK